MTCDLTFKHYREILESLMRQGYAIASFDTFVEKRGSSKIVVLRHDVDSLPDKSLKCAEIENHLGIRSTYFIRSYATSYQLNDSAIIEMIDSIKKAGHEIGLHYETGNLMKNNADDPETLFIKEKKLLEEVCGFNVISAASHSDKSLRRWMRSPKAKISKGWISQIKRRFPHKTKSFIKSVITGLEVRGIRTPLYSAIRAIKDDLFQVVDKEKVGIVYQSWDDNLCRGFVHAMEGRAVWKPCCPCQLIGKYKKLMITTHPEHWS